LNSSTKEDDIKLFKELEYFVDEAKKDIIIVGDFNFPEINWDLQYSTKKQFWQYCFLNTLQNLLLLQHVNFATRERGSDTPHTLDLVITESQSITNIEALAPLGKSDHVMLMIVTNFLNDESPVDQKYNLNRGDYEALRSFMDRDWDNDFAAINYDIEMMWNTLKTKIDDGVQCFIPLTARFNSIKWKRPLKEEIRDQIRLKKCLWRKYIQNKDTLSRLQYVTQRNKVKKIIRNDLKEEQNMVAQQYKSNL